MNNLGFLAPEHRQRFGITEDDVKALVERDGPMCRGFLFCTGFDHTHQQYIYTERPCKYKHHLWNDATSMERMEMVQQMNELASIIGRRPQVLPVTTCNHCLREFDHYEREREEHSKQQAKAKRDAKEKAQGAKARQIW